MMESQENEFRENADEEFIQSLNQLENILNQPQPAKKTESPVNPAKQTSEGTNTNNSIDWDAWEDAVADIEQFLEKQQNTDDE